MSGPIVQSSYSRVWIIENPGPAAVLRYVGCAKIGDPSWDLGETQRVDCPDPDRYGEFIEVDEIAGSPERVTSSMMARYDFGYSDLLRLARQRCVFDTHVLIGKCDHPQDYRSGWAKMQLYPRSRLSTYSQENLGAIERGEKNPTNEMVDFSARELLEQTQSAIAELCAASVVRELVSVDLCDGAQCGDCGESSDGCQKVLAVQLGTGATPGTLPSVVYSKDGGDSCAQDSITSMFSNETPEDSECVGGRFVVIASTSNSLHHKVVADILAGVAGGWAEVIQGFQSTAPRAIWSAHGRATWIVGDSGAVWFADDPTTLVQIQAAGLTTQQLRDVNGSDSDHVVAVGNNNTVLYTLNGSSAPDSLWQSVTGPSVGVALTAVWVFAPRVWAVGDAAGGYFYTLNAGQTWVQIADLPGSLTTIDDIQFTESGIGYLSGRAGASGKVLKSTAWGARGTWYVLPEKGTALPANDRINSLAVCDEKPNVVFGAGLGDNATDGILVKVA